MPLTMEQLRFFPCIRLPGAQNFVTERDLKTIHEEFEQGNGGQLRRMRNSTVRGRHYGPCGIVGRRRSSRLLGWSRAFIRSAQTDLR